MSGDDSVENWGLEDLCIAAWELSFSLELYAFRFGVKSDVQCSRGQDPSSE
jgi:hypothetical protein